LHPFGHLAPAPVAGTCTGSYTASIFFPLCPGGGFTAIANSSFATDGVDYNHEGTFNGVVRTNFPDVRLGDNPAHCYQDGYLPVVTAFTGFMNLSRIGQADFVAPYGDFSVPIHAQFSVGSSSVLGTLGGENVSGRFSCTY
jgi:hypothetical protein